MAHVSQRDNAHRPRRRSHDVSPTLSTPAHLLVGSTVDGFATALQHMRIGDRWLVYIPWQLGYGEVAKDAIPAYSTLVFDLQLKGFARAGYATK